MQICIPQSWRRNCSDVFSAPRLKRWGAIAEIAWKFYKKNARLQPYTSWWAHVRIWCIIFALAAALSKQDHSDSDYKNYSYLSFIGIGRPRKQNVSLQKLLHVYCTCERRSICGSPSVLQVCYRKRNSGRPVSTADACWSYAPWATRRPKLIRRERQTMCENCVVSTAEGLHQATPRRSVRCEALTVGALLVSWCSTSVHHS